MRLDKAKVASVVHSDYGQRMLEEGDRAQAGNPEKEQVWMLLVDEIDPDPEQPRRHFDEASLQDLAADIARRGVLQPIMVRPVGDRYRIILGERRWRATRIAGKPRIPCLIRNLDPTSIRQAQLVENVIRQGISDIERGLALRQLYEDMKAQDRKVTWETIAQMVGLTRMRINHLYNLSLLPQVVVEMIQARRLSGSHGVELARLHDRPDLLVALAEECSRKETGSGAYGMSVAQVRQRVAEILGGTAQERKTRPATSLQIERHARELTSALRPDMSEAARQRLRATAETILRYLDDPPSAAGGENVKSALQNGPGQDPEDIVKSTLQNRFLPPGEQELYIGDNTEGRTER